MKITAPEAAPLETVVRCGVDAYLDPPNGMADLFVDEDQGYYRFPCNTCTHRDAASDFCCDCRHYGG